MSNSSLVSYTKISPNKTSPRNHKIDTISIHCMAGNLSIESCGNLFANANRKASSNYGIGTDGRIGLYVEEKDRSWCTSNSMNDNRAITIEVANDGGAETGWHVSDKAYDALINLLVDICKRNDIDGLRWKGDRTLIGKVDKQNMTVHRWFANKACPGDYLYNLHPQIAADVNKRLDVQIQPEKIQNESKFEVENDSIIWKKLKNVGYSDIAVAGIMGNLYAESGLKTNNLQNSYNKKFNMTDEEYTAAVNNKTYSMDQFIRDKAGYGLAQWTFWSRKKGLYNYTIGSGTSIDNLSRQIEFLILELSPLTTQLNHATTVVEASNIILTQYERPADQGFAVQQRRATYSNNFYTKFHK